jgi:hypothetical protein
VRNGSLLPGGYSLVVGDLDAIRQLRKASPPFGTIRANKVTMPKATKESQKIRILDAGEYPTSITARRGAYDPIVEFAAIHPLGLYHVEDQGAGHRMAYFTPKRKGSIARAIGGASSLAGALTRISDHEDQMLHPDPGVLRQMGQFGPVNIFRLGQRMQGSKPDSELDRDIRQWCARQGIAWK